MTRFQFKRRRRQLFSSPPCFWRLSLRYTNTMSVYGYSFRLLRNAACDVVDAPALFPVSVPVPVSMWIAVRRASGSGHVTLTSCAGDGETKGRRRAADSCDGETKGGTRPAASCRSPLPCARQTHDGICGRDRHRHHAAAFAVVRAANSRLVQATRRIGPPSRQPRRWHSTWRRRHDQRPAGQPASLCCRRHTGAPHRSA